MIKISIEVSSGDVRSRVKVRAESIERALGLAKARYPGSEVRMLFPIDPESFFVTGTPDWAGPVSLEMQETMAG
jgi:hypothetical protein